MLCMPWYRRGVPRVNRNAVLVDEAVYNGSLLKHDRDGERRGTILRHINTQQHGLMTCASAQQRAVDLRVRHGRGLVSRRQPGTVPGPRCHSGRRT